MITEHNQRPLMITQSGSGANSVIALADDDAEEPSTGDGPRQAAGRGDCGVLAAEVLKITI